MIPKMYPKQVDIEVTNACNLQCKLCPNVDNKGFPVGHMSLELFKSIVDKVDFDATIVPWLNGEPQLNPEYPAMLRYLREKGKRYYVTTNLTLWRHEVFEEIFHPETTCYQVIISLDGLWNTGNIAKARPGTNEMLLRTHLLWLKEAQQKCSASSPHVDIAVKICERGQDWGEIEKFIMAWVEEVDFVVLGKPLKGSNTETMRTEPCQYSDNNFMVIRWDGTAIMCAYCDEVANNLALSYGKVTADTDLIEMYNNEIITKFREDQRAGRYPKPCNLCTFAYTGMGMNGTVAFRAAPEKSYFFQADYYNSFFSKTQKRKPLAYYKSPTQGTE